MPTSAPAARHVAAVAATLVAVTTVGLGVTPGPVVPAHAAAGTVPSRVLDVDVDQAAGSEVQLRPSALRTEAGTAEVDVVLGADAPGDVVVDLALAEPAVAADGTVTPGAPATVGRTTGGGRLRPGEVLRATISEVESPVVVVASVRPAGAEGASAAGDAAAQGAATLAAVVLPGPAGPGPTIDLEAPGGELRGTITADAPLLVTARLRGQQVLTHPDRLVLPGQPVVLTGTAARWPLPSELVVTDEAGRTTTVSTGGTALRVLAAALVVAATVALVLLVRRRRGTART